MSLSLLLAGASAAATEPSMLDAEPIAREEVATRLKSATSQFAVDLYGALRGRQGNVFYSPINIAAALAMTSAGARGETAAEIERTLHLDRLDPQARAEFGRWIGSIRDSIRSGGGEPGAEPAGLWMANALWIDQRERLLPEFTALLDQAYQARARAVDFAKSPDASRKQINAWVEEQTRNRIRDLLQPPLISSDTAFVLTSAIYFKGYWIHPFSPSSTRDDDFHPAMGDAVRVRMMNQTIRVPYFENDALQVVELPYRDGSLAMVVVLPRTRDGLAALESALTVEKLDSWTAGLKPSQVKLSLPRFTSTVEAELKDVLSQLGMPRAFQGDADFSGMTGSRDFALSAVVHKAFVEVEEKGTEAAAATAVVGVRTSAIIPQREIVFRADHPFLHLIRDRKTGAILFMGRLSRP